MCYNGEKKKADLWKVCKIQRKTAILASWQIVFCSAVLKLNEKTLHLLSNFLFLAAKL